MNFPVEPKSVYESINSEIQFYHVIDFSTVDLYFSGKLNQIS